MFDYEGNSCCFCGELFNIFDDVSVFQDSYCHQTCLEDYFAKELEEEE